MKKSNEIVLDVILKPNGYYYLKKIMTVKQNKELYSLHVIVQKPNVEKMFETTLNCFESHLKRLAGIYGELQSMNYSVNQVLHTCTNNFVQVPFKAEEYVCSSGKVYVNPYFVHEIPTK